jgi:hypothetical protein
MGQISISPTLTPSRIRAEGRLAATAGDPLGAADARRLTAAVAEV